MLKIIYPQQWEVSWIEVSLMKKNGIKFFVEIFLQWDPLKSKSWKKNWKKYRNLMKFFGLELIYIGVMMIENKDQVKLNSIIDNSPWMVNGHRLWFEKWSSNQRINKWTSHTCHFGCSNLLLEHINQMNYYSLGRRIGETILVNDGILFNDQCVFLHVKVMLNVKSIFSTKIEHLDSNGIVDTFPPSW